VCRVKSHPPQAASGQASCVIFWVGQQVFVATCSVPNADFGLPFRNDSEFQKQSFKF
jgi:hypothetical protein